MRILYLTNGFPYPLTSGYLRHYHFIRELSENHSITLVSLAGPKFCDEDRQAMLPFAERIEVFQRDAARRQPFAKFRRSVNLVTGRDAAIENLRQCVRTLVEENQFDVIFLSGKHLMSIACEFASIPIVVDICDAASVRFQGRLRHSPWVEKPRLFLGCEYMKHVERSLARSADHLLFASCRDLETLDAYCELPGSTVVPNGVDIQYWSRRSANPATSNRIVFTGAMHYPPNEDAALFLIHRVLPLVRKRLPDAELYIVGRDPTPALRQCSGLPGVKVTGMVEDMRPYLEEAAVFAAPLRFGAGIQNKVLEAMAMEVPVVATELAADGLRTLDGQRPPIDLAEEPAEFSAAILRELMRVDRVPRREARQYVRENFVWNCSAERIHDVFQSLATNAAVGVN